MSSLMSPFQPCCVVGVATLKRGREVKAVSPGGGLTPPLSTACRTAGRGQRCAFHRGLFPRVLSLKRHTSFSPGGWGLSVQ